jgi:adenine specific DNA methylase Mod
MHRIQILTIPGICVQNVPIILKHLVDQQIFVFNDFVSSVTWSHHAGGLVDPNFDLQKNRNWF